MKTPIMVKVSLAALALAGPALADDIFRCVNDHGFVSVFNAHTAAGELWGDSGFFDQPQLSHSVSAVTLGLSIEQSTAPGTTDLVFLFTHGDPSGAVNGPGDPYCTVTLHDVPLPDASAGPQLFSVTVPLPPTLVGGDVYSAFGFAFGVENFNSDGFLGFQISTARGQQLGTFTATMSNRHDGVWTLYSFGPDPVNDVADIVCTVQGRLCRADYNGDAFLDFFDLDSFVGDFVDGINGADYNHDGFVDFFDFDAFIDEFQAGC